MLNHKKIDKLCALFIDNIIKTRDHKSSDKFVKCNIK